MFWNDRQKTRLRRLNVFSVFTVPTVLFHGIGSKITEYFCFDFLYGKNKTATILYTSCHTLITVHTKFGFYAPYTQTNYPLVRTLIIIYLNLKCAYPGISQTIASGIGAWKPSSNRCVSMHPSFNFTVKPHFSSCSVITLDSCGKPWPPDHVYIKEIHFKITWKWAIFYQRAQSYSYSIELKQIKSGNLYFSFDIFKDTLKY